MKLNVTERQVLQLLLPKKANDVNGKAIRRLQRRLELSSEELVVLNAKESDPCQHCGSQGGTVFKQKDGNAFYAEISMNKWEIDLIDAEIKKLSDKDELPIPWMDAIEQYEALKAAAKESKEPQESVA